MLKALMKVKIASILAFFSGKAKSKKVGMALVMVFAILYGACAFGFVMYSTFSAMAPSFVEASTEWMFFTLYALIATTTVMLGSVFTAKAQLFEAKDNELLLAMPIPTGAILFSRMITILLISLIYELIVAVPTLLAWFSCGQTLSAVGIMSFVLISLGVLLFAVAIASIIGFAIALLTKRTRHKTIVTVIITALFLAAFFFLYTKGVQALEGIVEYTMGLSEKFSAAAPLMYIGTAITKGNLLHLLAVMAILVVPFALVYLVLKKNFLAITLSRSNVSKIKYKKKKLKTLSPQKALLKQQLALLASSPTYITNSGMGIVLMLVVAVGMFIFQDTFGYITAELNTRGLDCAPVVIVFICVLSATTTFTAPSISIEGKRFWQLRVLPVSSKEIIHAKIKMSNIIVLPAIILLSLVSILAFRISWKYVPFTLIIPCLHTLLCANIGMMAGINRPIMNWTSETQPVKQSSAVLITMLGSIIVTTVPIIIVVVFALYNVLFWITVAYTIALLALYILSWRYLDTKGVEKLEQIAI